MCDRCGCDEGARPRLTDIASGRVTDLDPGGAAPDHGHDHDHDHAHPGEVERVPVERALLGRNDDLAAENRAWLAERGVLLVNLISSPGAGKTTLLERTLRDLAAERPLAVIEGDQETSRDAERLRASGAPVVQINTGAGCHLDAAMVRRGLEALDPARGALVFVENVGNLVCPALFDLGEAARVVVASTPEGDDKPLKYPHAFRSSQLLLLNKVDLLPYVRFDAAACRERARAVQPELACLEVSATEGTGLEAWYAWLRARPAPTAAAPAPA